MRRVGKVGHEDGDAGRAANVFRVFVVLALRREEQVEQRAPQPGRQRRIAR
jgi:hypothetical protein